jgi:carbamoyl-phosphate synthase small subunit
MYLALENGTVIQGTSAGADTTAKTELVFTTAYTGYEESLTDPSYNGQGLIFAYPLIGNYGVDSRRFESDSVQPDLVIARELTDEVSQWLSDSGIPALTNVNTRRLVRAIREEGSMVAGAASTQRAAQRLCADAVTQGVTMTYRSRDDLPKRYGNGHRPIVAMLDCGVKTSMIDKLVEREAHVVRLPWDVNVEHIWSYDPDVLFVSNGPGDPTNYQKAIETIEQAHGQVPIAGICLGQQLITLALGGSTRKMKFGHRGVNQPVMDRRTNRVRMTTQNHSYEVNRVPEALDVTQHNVNDNSPEGLDGDGVLCRQYHPEANPGPNDSLDFFDDVLSL